MLKKLKEVNIMSEKIGFFEEETNSRSHMRLMSFLVFWLLVVINFVVLRFSYYADNAFDSYFVSFVIGINFLFLVAIFYPKYLQKILELGQAKFQKVKEKALEKLPSNE